MLKIKLLNDNDQTVARTIIKDGKWLATSYVENWVDSFEEAFEYEFCDDANHSHYYGMLEESIQRDFNEIMEAYNEGEEEYLFYV